MNKNKQPQMQQINGFIAEIRIASSNQKNSVSTLQKWLPIKVHALSSSTHTTKKQCQINCQDRNVHFFLFSDLAKELGLIRLGVCLTSKQCVVYTWKVNNSSIYFFNAEKCYLESNLNYYIEIVLFWIKMRH